MLENTRHYALIIDNRIILMSTDSWTGPEKSQEGACDGFNPRKNPRAELATIDGYLDSKRQRTTGTFGEASMVRCWFLSLLVLANITVNSRMSHCKKNSF